LVLLQTDSQQTDLTVHSNTFFICFIGDTTTCRGWK